MSMLYPIPLSLPRADAGSITRRHVRARERGAAMVEAAFMMPMFVLLFFTSIYAHNLYAKQIALNMTSRSQAWSLAMYNCSKGPGSPEGETLGAADSGGSGEATTISLNAGSGSSDSSSATSGALNGGSVSGAATSAISGVTSMISSIFPNPSGSQSVQNGSVSWRAPNLYNPGDNGGIQSTQVTQTVTIVCNEQAQNGNICTAIAAVVGAFGVSMSC
jgi:hypothetical protein